MLKYPPDALTPVPGGEIERWILRGVPNASVRNHVIRSDLYKNPEILLKLFLDPYFGFIWKVIGVMAYT